jgi:hypothetical protein
LLVQAVALAVVPVLLLVLVLLVLALVAELLLVLRDPLCQRSPPSKMCKQGCQH